MQDVNVVVVFYSRTGSTERLALAAAVGAVQGRAFIRLRRLPDPADALDDASPEWVENSERFNREYIAPREADALWADAIIVGVPDGAGALSAELDRYLNSLGALRDQGKFDGKIGAAFTRGTETGLLYDAMSRAGLITVPVTPDPDILTAARLQGRRVADLVRSRRARQEPAK
jgi:NAD(P)H dehydrogenase (quinone)